MEQEHSNNTPQKVNEVVIARRNDLKTFFDGDYTKKLIATYFEGNHLKADKFRQTLLMIAMDDHLRYTEPTAILKCGLQAAELQLPMEKALGQAYIVTYDNKAQLTIGYKGWQALLEQSNKSGKAHMHYDVDKFTMTIADHNEHFELIENHPQRNEQDSKWVLQHLQGVVVSIKNNETGIVLNRYVDIKKLNQLRMNSPAVKKNKYSAWTSWAAEMFMGKAMKYVISKTAMSQRIARAIEIENKADIILKGLPEEKSFLELESIGGAV